MKIAKQIPAYLLGLIFFGLGGVAYFAHLMPEQTLTGNTQAFMNVFGTTGYMTAIKVLELIGGLLILIPRTRALGLCIVAPIVLNIFFFEIFISKEFKISAILIVLTILAIYFEKDKFSGILSLK